MGERKVLNKYFPPDFDPKKVPRLKRDPLKQIGVRMMIPFSMQCNTCGEFMYRGKKFNSLKEDCIGEDYLDIKRFRFYIKCVICSQEITFKTDPENGDYELETGASRNFEAWTDKQATEEKHKKAREEEEKSDNMKALENRTLDSKIEMEIMDALDEIKAVNRRHETVDTAEVLKAAAARRGREANGAAGAGAAGAEQHGEEEEEEAMIASIQFGGPKVRRLSDDEDHAVELANTPSKDSRKGATKHRKGKPATASTLPSKQSANAHGGDHVVPVVAKGERGMVKNQNQNQNQNQNDSITQSAGWKGVSSSGDTPVSLLVSGIEAQARRQAEKAKAAAAAAGSAGTTIMVKRKRRDTTTSGSTNGTGEGGPGESVKSRGKKKKHTVHAGKDNEESSKDQGKTKKVTTPAAAGACLGGLLGAYDSSGSGDTE